MPSVQCTGTGANGDHCCYIAGKVCELLDTTGDIPRCSVWDKMNTGRWRNSPVGRWFAERHPGFTCRDWPQNIPDVMADRDKVGPFALCCFGRGND